MNNQKEQYPLTENAMLICPRECVEQCGILDDALRLAVATTCYELNETIVVSNKQVGIIKGDKSEQTELPKITVECDGKRRKYFLFGELVCRQDLIVRQNL